MSKEIEPRDIEPDDVIEGELVEDTLPGRPVRALAVRVDRHRAAALGKAVGVVIVTIGLGFHGWIARWWDGISFGAHRQGVDHARALGDYAALDHWVDKLETARQARHQRIKDLPLVVAGAAKATAITLAIVVVAVLLIAVLAQVSGSARFGDVVFGVVDAVGLLITVVVWGWLPLAVSLGSWVLVMAWISGRKAPNAPSWIQTTAELEADIVIDETTIAAALEALRIPQIRDHLRKGLPLQYITTAHRDGRGVRAVIRLPSGVPAAQISARREPLATGLHRAAKEVWPTTGDEAGILDLWIANKGALAEGAGPYPLLTDGAVDLFKGVPFGKTLRGDPLIAPILERNTICGGMPGQGKSSGARVIMAGAALDPTAELRIWVPDSNFDFEAFKPRCSRYVMGADDAEIAEILEHLVELHDEVQERGRLLIEHQEPCVTRALADAGVGLHPLVCLLEEAHVAITHAKFGADISELLVKIVKLGRKRAIHVIVSTQAPTKDSMPRDVTRNCSNGIAYAVGDHVANDALLGQGAYRAGHRATELIPGTDRGTAVCKGLTGERSELVQAYFLSISKGNDQVTPLIDRSLAAIEQLGRELPGANLPEFELAAERDLLEDLDEVLGDERIKTADVPGLLRGLAPNWHPYQRLDGKGLRERLERDHGIKVASTGNRWPLDPADIRAALARRSTADLDDHDS